MVVAFIEAICCQRCLASYPVSCSDFSFRPEFDEPALLTYWIHMSWHACELARQLRAAAALRHPNQLLEAAQRLLRHNPDGNHSASYSTLAIL